MAINSPYSINVNTSGTIVNTTSNTAPSLTDPLLNSAYKNQIVSAGGEYYFVDSTGKAVKISCCNGATQSDSIANALTDSSAAYAAAAVDTMVPITQAEYNNIAAISGSYKVATSDANISGATSAISSTATVIGPTSYTSAATGNLITTAGYLLAFKVRLAAGASFAVNSSAGYSATSNQGGFALATVATAATADASGMVYFVVKAPTYKAPANTLPRMFRAVGGGNMSFNLTGGQTHYNTAATSIGTIPNQSLAGTPCFQFIMNPNQLW